MNFKLLLIISCKFPIKKLFSQVASSRRQFYYSIKSLNFNFLYYVSFNPYVNIQELGKEKNFNFKTVRNYIVKCEDVFFLVSVI